MRTLLPRPEALVDPSTRALQTGSFHGGLPRVVASHLAGKGPLFRVAHEKRWIYAAVATDEVFIGAAVVKLGYAANTFAFAYDKTAGRMQVSRSAVGPPFAADVGDSSGAGAHAHFKLFGARVEMDRAAQGRDLRFEVELPDLHVSARLNSARVPPPIGAVAHLEGGAGGLFNATEKTVLHEVVGEAVAAGKHYSLDGGLGGYDYTSGYLARKTKWRWAFLLGRARSGVRVALNLVQGFVGEPECAVWVGDDLVPVSEGRFEFDPARPLSPWWVTTADKEVDLRFTPGGMHSEDKNLGLVVSKFVQPVGTFSGTLHLPGRDTIELDRVLGVVEDQDVTW